MSNPCDNVSKQPSRIEQAGMRPPGIVGGREERRSEMESPYAQQWQARARELRTQAEQMISPEAKSLMLGVADDYEHLTQITEAMALIRGVLASAIEDDESRTR
jgi:hypothetical protein